MYRDVAERPHGKYHFEMGRGAGGATGLPGRRPRPHSERGDQLLCRRRPLLSPCRRSGEGETVVDFGSGSGMDTFVAALKVGASGKVIGVDMTDAQRKKAESLRDRDGFSNVTYVKGYIEEVPLPAECADVVISNGVFNLSPDKPKVFREVARLLRPGGRLAIADIVTDVKLPETITCNTTLGPPASVAPRSGTTTAR